ncbi:hypothetical protein H2200_005170 [Cladophialophora chaetospira]|uniref:Uncharacterized protein n=1 Tax=Cladophialophora chaetospira TaxID=386627 RepID=A0AA39CJM8_9EURO|nr:hypothetical protein H2200_005170 [Cladophialophora chaetospira]
MSLERDLELKPTTTHEYSDNAIHIMHTESGEAFQIRLKRSLGGDNGVGFSMACTFVAECVAKDNPRHTGPFVVKIFDPRYSTRLREEFGAAAFDPNTLATIADAVDNGKYNLFTEKMISEYVRPSNLSERTQEIFSTFEVPDLPFGDVYSHALANEGDVCEAFVADGILDTPTPIDREMFVWLLSDHMFQHEASVHRYLHRFPQAPVARLKEVASITPISATGLTSSLSFGAIIMELVEGYPMSNLKELVSLNEESFRQAPSGLQKLVPTDKESAKRYFSELNQLIQFPTSVGILSRDPNLDNIMCSARGNGEGIKLTWIDVAQFQPLSAKQFHSPEPASSMQKMCLARFAIPVNEYFEDEMYDGFRFLWRRTGYSSTSMQELKLKRFREFGVSISTTFAWRLIMEDICINDWVDTEQPTDTRLSVLLMRMAKAIMGREKEDAKRQSRPGSGTEKQDCFHRAVLKLHFLLCSSEGDKLDCAPAALESVTTFEKLMADAGYPDGILVASHDVSGNSLLVDEKCMPPCMEYIVDHLRDRRIFPTRFWSDDWPFECIEAELETRFKKVMKLRAESLSGLGSLVRRPQMDWLGWQHELEAISSSSRL